MAAWLQFAGVALCSDEEEYKAMTEKTLKTQLQELQLADLNNIKKTLQKQL